MKMWRHTRSLLGEAKAGKSQKVADLASKQMERDSEKKVNQEKREPSQTTA